MRGSRHLDDADQYGNPPRRHTNVLQRPVENIRHNCTSIKVLPTQKLALASPASQVCLTRTGGVIAVSVGLKQAENCRIRIGQKVRKVRINRAFLAQLNGRDAVVDTEVMNDSALKQSEFEQSCLAVLNCYAVRDAAAKAATKDYAGWLDRIQDVQGIEKTTLTSIHGFLIAQGLIRFEFNGRSVGLQYQVSTQGREAITRESVYLSDDPHRNECGSDSESISHAA